MWDHWQLSARRQHLGRDVVSETAAMRAAEVHWMHAAARGELSGLFNLVEELDEVRPVGGLVEGLQHL